ncbi:MAG: hypothetical protein D6685_16065 [Bacteroidetes bacterium]|nr:MAG: hypothetical protein D6685_16065 [Bacteroidota bacterium]
MHVIFDNLNALVIGGVVVMVILSMQMRVAEINIEETANYMVKRQGVDLATWMEDDLMSLGLNIDKSAEVPFINPVDSAGITVAFEFIQDSINTTVSPPDTIRITTRYDLVSTGTTEVDGENVNIYAVQRRQRLDGGPWMDAGRSPGILSHFRIDMLNRDAVPISDPAGVAATKPDSIQNTRVRFTLVTPFETNRSTLSRIYYGSTLMIPQ